MNTNDNYTAKSMQGFYEKTYTDVFCGTKRTNHNRDWTKQDLEMLDLCTKTGEGIRNMISYFDRTGKTIKDKQRKQAQTRLTYLYQLHARFHLEGDFDAEESVKKEINFLVKFLNVDSKI